MFKKLFLIPLLLFVYACGEEEEPAPSYVGNWERSYAGTELYNDGASTRYWNYKEELAIKEDNTATLLIKKWANGKNGSPSNYSFTFALLNEYTYAGQGVLVVNSKTAETNKFNFKANEYTLTLTPEKGKAIVYTRAK